MDLNTTPAPVQSSNFPSRLYLQMSPDAPYKDQSEITHCLNRVNETDAEYVLAPVQSLPIKEPPHWLDASEAKPAITGRYEVVYKGPHKEVTAEAYYYNGDGWDKYKSNNYYVVRWRKITTLSPAPADQVREWQDIATAPKDGTEVLGWCDLGEDGFQVRPMSWPTHSPLSQAGRDGRTGPWQYLQDGMWRHVFPTHWMPLPKLPE